MSGTVREGRQVASATWDEAHRGRRTVDEPKTAALVAALNRRYMASTDTIFRGAISLAIGDVRDWAARAEVAEPSGNCDTHSPDNPEPSCAACWRAEVAEPGDVDWIEPHIYGASTPDWQAGYRAAFDRLNARSPFGIWRGMCGHVWDRRDEDTDECPRCAATAGREPLDALRDPQETHRG